MYSKAIHESRKLKHTRPASDQYVGVLRLAAPATPSSNANSILILRRVSQFVQALGKPNYRFFPNPQGFFSADGVLPYKSSPLTREDRLTVFADGAQHSKILPLAQADFSEWCSRFKKAPLGPSCFGRMVLKIQKGSSWPTLFWQDGAKHSKCFPWPKLFWQDGAQGSKRLLLAQADFSKWCSTHKNTPPGPKGLGRGGLMIHKSTRNPITTALSTKSHHNTRAIARRPLRSWQFRFRLRSR